MRHFQVKNFERFQHYKDRNPPWIKLYNELLDDYDFGRLQDASKMHLIAIWLLASRSDNRIPYDSEWVSRRINATDPVDLDTLVKAGFIEIEQDCSNSLAECRQDARPEREGETEGDSVLRTSADAPLDLKSQIFGPCLRWLSEHTDKPPDKLRPLVGRWCRDFGDGAVIEAVGHAARDGPVDPIAWIEARLRPRVNGGRKVAPEFSIEELEQCLKEMRA